MTPPPATPAEHTIQRLTIDLANERVQRAHAEARVDYLTALLAEQVHVPAPGADPATMGP